MKDVTKSQKRQEATGLRAQVKGLTLKCEVRVRRRATIFLGGGSMEYQRMSSLCEWGLQRKLRF